MYFYTVISFVFLVFDFVGALGETVVPRQTGVRLRQSDVVVIDRKNFAQTMKEGKWLVEFYTPWCPHCKTLQPTWEDLATELKGKVNVGKVNCELEMALCKRFHVKGFPTLIHVNNRKTRPYKSKSRSIDALRHFALEGYRLAPAANWIKSPFGPVEVIKGAVVGATVYARERLTERLKQGTPRWTLFLGVIAMLVVGTVVVSLTLMVLTGMKPKRE